MNIKQIEEVLSQTEEKQLTEAMQPFLSDTRAGVKKVLLKYQRKVDRYEEALKAWEMRLCFDEVIGDGEVVVGIDEVGRGPLAGPVVAAAVILPKDAKLVGLRDSKKLSETQREQLYDQILKIALSVGVGIVDATQIDKINILQATFEAMRQAVAQMKEPYAHILVDGNKTIPGIMTQQTCIISGDDKSASIAAASVVAKVTRDRMMCEYANCYPGYDWEHNKGYGSTKHYEGIRHIGITPLHRKTFLKNEGIF